MSMKRGQGGGMAMMLPLLMILLFVGLMVCNKKDDKKQPPVTPPQIPQSQTSILLQNESNACYEAGFFTCAQCPTDVSMIDLPAGNGTCCNIPCEGSGEGNVSLTCAFQKGFACAQQEQCAPNQLVSASDARCCKVPCTTRVQTQLSIEGIGNVVIERIAVKTFGVYYGQNVSLGGVDIGKAAFAYAVPRGNDVYEFETTDNKKFKFAIIKETETEIIAGPVGTATPMPALSELEAKKHLVDTYNPGIVFGMPRPISDAEMQAVFGSAPALVQYVKDMYNVTRDIDVYTRARQFLGIQLSPAPEGYFYTFADGQSCTITAYEGKVIGMPVSDTVTKKEQNTVPC